MKRFIQYIQESGLKELKDIIINSLDSLDEKTLHRIINIINSINYKEEDIDKVFKQLGLFGSKDGILNIISKFNSTESTNFLNIILSNDDKSKFSNEEFIHNNNIFDLIISKNKNLSKESLLKIAEYDKKSGTQIGKFEILCTLFLKDIKLDGKSDVKAGNIEYEFKTDGGVLKGQSTTDYSKIVYKEFNDELIELLNSDNISDVQKNQSSLIRLPVSDDDLDKFINDSDFYNDVTGKGLEKYNFLSKENDFENYFSKLLNHNISGEILNTLLCNSLIKQIKESQDLSKDEINSHKDKLIKFMNEHSPFENNKVNVKQFRSNLLVIHTFFYHLHHKWNYLVIFGRNGYNGTFDGKYVCIGDNKGELFNDFEKINNEFKNYKISYKSVGMSTNDYRQVAPSIKLYSKDIK